MGFMMFDLVACDFVNSMSFIKTRLCFSSELWQFSENSLNTFIRFAWNDSFPSLSHYICSHSFTESWLFGLLRKVSSGSRAKTATLSLLYQTGVKSTNRLLWPNVIKLQPGSGQFTVRQFCLSRVSCISTEQKLSILPFKKKKIKKKRFHYYQAWIGRILWNNPIVRSLPHSALQLVAQWK